MDVEDRGELAGTRETRVTTTSYSRGQKVAAEVTSVFPFGVFACLPDGTTAYIRRRELTPEGNIEPRKVVSRGETVEAVVVELPAPGQNLELSLRRLQPDPWEQFVQEVQRGDTIPGTVKSVQPDRVFVQIRPGVDGSISLREMAPWPVERPEDLFWVGDRVEAEVTHLNHREQLVRLSVRRRVVRQKKAIEISRTLATSGHADSQPQAADAYARPARDQKPPPARGLQSIGRVLVADDHEDILAPLVEWLQRRGCAAEGVRTLDEARCRLDEAEFGLALVDLDLSGEDGLELVRRRGESSPECRFAVISTPDILAARGRELLKLDIAEVLAKPLDLEEVEECLTRLAEGEESTASRRWTEVGEPQQETAAFDRLAQQMRGGRSLQQRLEEGLRFLIETTGAEKAVFFHRDPAATSMSVLAEAGRLPLRPRALYSLNESPVKDLIEGGRHIFERCVSQGASARFSKLLDLLTFESCIGVPVPVGGEVRHALFLFHRKAEAFSHYRSRDANAVAALFSLALENEAFVGQVQEQGRFLVGGQLAAGFGHEAYNRMSALELRVRNLCDEFAGLIGGDGQASQTGSDDWSGLGDSLQALLGVTLEMKEVVTAFRELSRAEGREEVNVNTVLRRAETLLRPTARSHRVQIIRRLAEQPLTVRGSAVRLLNVFSNLMLNAVQHTARKMEWLPDTLGLLEVSSFSDPDDPKRPIKVRFADTGPGIHHRLWERIFDLGYSTREGGTGQGLFIARSLVEALGGSITVEESVVPLGTTFLVELPVSIASSGVAAPEEE